MVIFASPRRTITQIITINLTNSKDNILDRATHTDEDTFVSIFVYSCNILFENVGVQGHFHVIII